MCVCLAFMWGTIILSFSTCLSIYFHLLHHRTSLPVCLSSPTLFLASHFSYIHTYLFCHRCYWCVSKHERRKVGCDPEGTTEKEGDKKKGDGWGKNRFGERMMVPLCNHVCICVCVCVYAKAWGSIWHYPAENNPDIAPQKCSHHALLSVWEKLMHGHTEKQIQMPK